MLTLLANTMLASRLNLFMISLTRAAKLLVQICEHINLFSDTRTEK